MWYLGQLFAIMCICVCLIHNRLTHFSIRPLPITTQMRFEFGTQNDLRTQSPKFIKNAQISFFWTTTKVATLFCLVCQSSAPTEFDSRYFWGLVKRQKKVIGASRLDSLMQIRTDSSSIKITKNKQNSFVNAIRAFAIFRRDQIARCNLVRRMRNL